MTDQHAKVLRYYQETGSGLQRGPLPKAPIKSLSTTASKLFTAIHELHRDNQSFRRLLDSAISRHCWSSMTLTRSATTSSTKKSPVNSSTSASTQAVPPPSSPT